MPFVVGGLALLMFGFSRWYFALLGAAFGFVLPERVAGAPDGAAAEADSQRPAGRARPDDRLHRGRLGHRPGDHEDERRARHHLSGARRGNAAGHDRDARRQAAPRGVQELRLAHEGRRGPLAGVDADSDRPVRHQHRAGPANSRGGVPHQAAAERGGTRRRRSASSWCSRWCSVCFRRCTSRFSVRRSSSTSGSSNPTWSKDRLGESESRRSEAMNSTNIVLIVVAGAVSGAVSAAAADRASDATTSRPRR